MKVLFHTVLISLKAQAVEKEYDNILRLGQELGDRCGGVSAGILKWTFERNLDMRKNIHFVEFVTFKDAESLQRFRDHPAHLEFISRLKGIGDWQIGDVMVEC